MTIAMKTSGDGTTPGGSEPGQETTALGNTTPNQNSPATVNTDPSTSSQNVKEKETEEEGWLDPAQGSHIFLLVNWQGLKK